MYLRSLLFIPGDSDRKLAKADASGADAVILDLEDSVAPAQRAAARAKVRAFLDARPPAGRRMQLWVRVTALDESAAADLDAIMGGAPEGIVLPKAEGPGDVARLSALLDAQEARAGLEAGRTKICIVATETAAAVLRLPEFAQARLPRLLAMNWGAEDLSASLGAADSVDADGARPLTYQMARATMLLAAKAAGAQALEAVYIDYRDSAGLAAAARAAAREGFTGMTAIHPDQVAAINAAFTPSAEDVAKAEQIVAAFAQAGDVGAIGIGGKMYDIPHLKRARRLLALHEAYAKRGG